MTNNVKPWDSQQGSDRKTSILLVAFWNFKLKALKYPSICRLHATLILNLVKPLVYLHTSNAFAKCHISSTIWIMHDVCKSVAAIYQYVFIGSGCKGARGCHTCPPPRLLRHRIENWSRNRQYISSAPQIF